MNTASISSLCYWCEDRQIRNKQTVANNDCDAFCAVDKCRPVRLALIGDRLESNAVLVLALVLCRALQPLDEGGLFGVNQARKC